MNLLIIFQLAIFHNISKVAMAQDLSVVQVVNRLPVEMVEKRLWKSLFHQNENPVANKREKNLTNSSKHTKQSIYTAL